MSGYYNPKPQYNPYTAPLRPQPQPPRQPAPHDYGNPAQHGVQPQYADPTSGYAHPHAYPQQYAQQPQQYAPPQEAETNGMPQINTNSVSSSYSRTSTYGGSGSGSSGGISGWTIWIGIVIFVKVVLLIIKLNMR